MTKKKECPRCTQTKPLKDFYKHRDAVQTYCKSCAGLYVASIRKANVTVRKNACKFNRIREVLELKEIDGNVIAERVGRDKGVFHKWVRNEQQPALFHLFEIADALNVKPSELINNDAQDIDKVHSERYIVKEAFSKFPIIYTNKEQNDLNFVHRTNWIEGYNAALKAIKIE